jgi:hypothetical protein
MFGLGVILKWLQLIGILHKPAMHEEETPNVLAGHVVPGSSRSHSWFSDVLARAYTDITPYIVDVDRYNHREPWKSFFSRSKDLSRGNG